MPSLQLESISSPDNIINTGNPNVDRKWDKPPKYKDKSKCKGGNLL